MSTIWFKDESGQLRWFAPEDVKETWHNAYSYEQLYLLTSGAWVLGPVLYEPFGAWTCLTEAQAVEWFIKAHVPEPPPQLSGAVRTMHVSGMSQAPASPLQATAWPLQPAGEDFDTDREFFTYIIEKTLYRQTGDLWVLFERAIHQEAEIESWRRTVILAPAQAATLLMENGHALPAELVPYVQTPAPMPADPKADEPLVVAVAAEPPPPSPPWTEKDLEVLQDIPAKLVAYMWDHPKAGLSSVSIAVWGEKWKGRNAIKQAVKKANAFLGTNGRTIAIEGDQLLLE